MAGRTSVLLVLSSLLFLTLCVLSSAEKLSLETISVAALLPSSGSSISRASVTASGENSFPLVERTTAITEEAHRTAFAKDSLRVASIHKKVLNGSVPSFEAQSDLSIGASDFGITVRFGTPAKNQTLLIDTGSDVCWIQCEPCLAGCYDQRDPIFVPAYSASYRNFSCYSKMCMGLASRRCIFGDTCLYGLIYGDNSTSNGFFATETLRTMSGQVFNDFAFGCGQLNEGFLRGFSGVFGLGRTRYSLNFQLAYKFQNVFSYCLPSKGTRGGYFRLGNPLKITTGHTAMLSDTRAPSLYFLNLTGITLGGSDLDIPQYVFQASGTIMDTGTEITRLPPVAYSILREAFRASMAAYPAAEAFGVMETCYDLRKYPTIAYPTIRFQFNGLYVTLPASGVFYVVSPSQVCLAFAGNYERSQVSIIGSFQQRTIEITYDNDLKRIGFSEGACV